MVSILLGLSLSVASIIIGSANITSDLADAVKAFHCADSGIERALYNASGWGTVSCDDISVPPSGTGFVGATDSGYHYNVNDIYTVGGGSMDSTLDCAQTGTTIISSGLYGSATRRIKISY